MNLSLDAPLSLLLGDYRELKTQGEPMVLATVVDTAGSTYRKAGTRMLLSGKGEIRGLLSGGCLEQDLAGHASAVLDDGQGRIVYYDMRGPDDEIFGLGSGCEGAMRILLQRVGPAEDWQPLEAVAAACAAGRRELLVTVVGSDDPACPVGAVFWNEGRAGARHEPAAIDLARRALDARKPGDPPAIALQSDGLELLAAVLAPPAQLLVLGGGPDVVPLARLASTLGFAVTIADHRPAYARADRFPGCRVVVVELDQPFARLAPADYDAALVMSHHLVADAAYLAGLAAAGPRYVGLLGPSARRDRLLDDIGPAAAGLAGRLRAPVGLDIGARSPEAIAVSIVAEIHAALCGRTGASAATRTAPARAAH